MTEVDGPPLYVVQDGGTLTVSYEDLPWNGSQGFKQWIEAKPWKAWSGSASGRKAWERSASFTLTVPAATQVRVAAVDATAFVSGISGGTDVNGVSGDATLVGLSGRVKAHTVSGSVEAQSVTGDLGFHSVSGGLTVVDGAGVSVRADSVSGDMLIDLDLGPAAERPVDIALNSVSGQVAIRLPHPADARVEANTATGGVSNAFEDLRVSGQLGAKRITGTLGTGAGDPAGHHRLRRHRAAAPPAVRRGRPRPRSPRARQEGALTCRPSSPTAVSASTSSSCSTRPRATGTR